MNGVNELDLQMQDIRRDEMAALSEEASLLREQATDIMEAMDNISNYLDKMETLCVEVCCFRCLFVGVNLFFSTITWQIMISSRLSVTIKF